MSAQRNVPICAPCLKAILTGGIDPLNADEKRREPTRFFPCERCGRAA